MRKRSIVRRVELQMKNVYAAVRWMWVGDRQLVINLLRALGFLALFTVLLFGCAGRWDLPFVWAYLGVYIAATLVAVFVVDPGLQAERWHPATRENDFWLMALVMMPGFVAHLIIAALDVGRFHWSDDVPRNLQIAALAIFAVSMGVALWATAVNRFFSPVIRIQAERGHRLVTAGPYRYVRHPGYASGIVFLLSSPLALGSWLALIPIVLAVLLIIRRTVFEDRFLHEKLPGYPAYAERVRYRLVPGVW
jgi:protein-S-isoprenylcysteine O-methyltransferase Ste14